MKQLWLLEPLLWRKVKDGTHEAFALFQKHYSYHQCADNRRDNPRYRNQKLIVGPGGKMVLLTPRDDALFVWRNFFSMDRQAGVNCAVFWNESPYRSSDLILAAESLAWERWPSRRLYTYVNPKMVQSRNPGYCFLVAGWRKCGVTAKGLLIFEKYIEWS